MLIKWNAVIKHLCIYTFEYSFERRLAFLAATHTQCADATKFGRRANCRMILYVYGYHLAAAAIYLYLYLGLWVYLGVLHTKIYIWFIADSFGNRFMHLIWLMQSNALQNNFWFDRVLYMNLQWVLTAIDGLVCNNTAQVQHIISLIQRSMVLILIIFWLVQSLYRPLTIRMRSSHIAVAANPDRTNRTNRSAINIFLYVSPLTYSSAVGFTANKLIFIFAYYAVVRRVNAMFGVLFFSFRWWEMCGWQRCMNASARNQRRSAKSRPSRKCSKNFNEFKPHMPFKARFDSVLLNEIDDSYGRPDIHQFLFTPISNIQLFSLVILTLAMRSVGRV